MSFIRYVFQGTSIDFFNNNSSSEVSDKRDYNIMRAVKRPLIWLTALGLLIANAGATNVFAHSENVVAPDRVANMKKPLQPEFSITRAPEVVECYERFQEVLKNIFYCPLSRALAKDVVRNRVGFACVASDLPVLLGFDPDYKVLTISANYRKHTQFPQSKYMLDMLRALSRWLYAEDFIILRKKRCDLLPSEYADLKEEVSLKSIEISEAMLNGCVEKGYWPEKFLYRNLAARELIAKYIASGEYEDLLAFLKSTLREDELKDFESASREKVAELAVKYLVRLQKKENIPLIRTEDLIEEWHENCQS